MPPTMIRQVQTPATATTVPPPPPAVGVQEADLGTLQGQLANLHTQQAGLQAQWRGLKSQLDNMLRSNPARPGVQQQWADVGVQLARVDGDVAALQTRIALKQGRPVGIPGVGVRPPWNNPGIIIPSVSVVSLVMLLPISVAWAKRIGRRAPAPAPIPSDLTNRLERIEQAVDTIAIEVERISEGQRFVTKIMVERPSTSAAPTEQAPAQTKQPLALGAGEAAVKPIVVPEQQRVRN
jgi:hypothetical protein